MRGGHGGGDAIAFAGGIGERSPEMSGRILLRLEFLGIDIDLGENDRADGDAVSRISEVGAAVHLWVVPTDEEGQIARELYDLLS